MSPARPKRRGDPPLFVAFWRVKLHVDVLECVIGVPFHHVGRFMKKSLIF
jgi:hypothetical protein